MTRAAKEQLRGARHYVGGLEITPAPEGWDVALGAVLIGTLYGALWWLLPRCAWRRLGLVEVED